MYLDRLITKSRSKKNKHVFVMAHQNAKYKHTQIKQQN